MFKQKQKTAVDRQRAHGDSLREWLHGRRIEAGKRLARLRKEAAARPVSRGVDRVPDRYRVHTPAPVVVVEHTDANYADRRGWARSQGRSLPSSRNTPHVNPARDRKPAARLRKELR